LFLNDFEDMAPPQRFQTYSTAQVTQTPAGIKNNVGPFLISIISQAAKIGAVSHHQGVESTH